MASLDQTDSSGRGYSRWRRIFGIVFLVSTIAGALLIAVWLAFPPEGGSFWPAQPPTPTAPVSATETPGNLPTPTPTQPAGPGFDLGGAAGALAIAASCLTSLTSLMGFVFTTFIGFRKERREAQSAEIERKIRELELERQRLELESRKRDSGADEENR